MGWFACGALAGLLVFFGWVSWRERRRRAPMTAEERRQEDEAIRDEGWMGW